ncbi:MAG: hypothetical protein V4801_02335 [Burkholderia gladioli]
MSYFSSRPDIGSCWRCEHWAGDLIAGCHCGCRHGGTYRVQTNPVTGCAFWSLSPGLDGMTDKEADALVRATCRR